MAEKQEKMSLGLKIHNATCPAWLLKIGPLRKVEPGCRAASKHTGGKQAA